MNARNIASLLGIASVGASVAKAHLIQRFISNLTGIITLAIASGLMAGALLIGGFYAAYEGLVRYGQDPLVSKIIIVGLGVVTLIVMLAVTSMKLRQLRGIPSQLFQGEFPLASRLNGIADSFLDGFFASQRTPRKESL